MNTDIYDVIIIGAGLSGITCAKTILNNAKKINLKIIAPEIGGQLQFLDDINYGPYFIRNDYVHTSTLFKKTDEVTRKDFLFHNGKKSYTSGLNIGTLKHLRSHCAFRKILFYFNREFKKFRKDCFVMPQSTALESNPYLLYLYNQNALTWIIENGLYDYYNDFLVYVLQSISFCTAEQMNAFHLLSLLTSFHIGTYRYSFNKEYFNDIDKHHIQDRVELIKKLGNNYVIHTQNGLNIQTKQIVLATPPVVSSHLCNFNHNKPVSSYMFHLKGDIKEEYRIRRTNLFNPKDEITVIDKISSKENEFLLHAKTPNPPISNVFNQYTIINEKFWENCFYWGGSHIIPFEQDKHFFVIGNHNVPLLEDVHIYATYAANVVLKNL